MIKFKQGLKAKILGPKQIGFTLYTGDGSVSVFIFNTDSLKLDEVKNNPIEEEVDANAIEKEEN